MIYKIDNVFFSSCTCILKAEKRGVTLYNLLKELTTSPELSKGAIITGQPCDLKLLWSLRDVWRQEFSSSLETIVSTRVRLDRLKEEAKMYPGDMSDSSTTVVGVYVRLLEDGETGNGFTSEDVLPSRYYEEAFSYFRERYNY